MNGLLRIWCVPVWAVAPLAAIFAVVLGCSAEPENGAGGSCVLDCSKSVIADSNFTATALSVGGTINCLGVGEGQVAKLSAPVLAKFKITGEFDGQTVPRANIGFDPVVVGMRSEQDTNPENATVTTDASGVVTVTPYKFAGVVTPKSEWCTDSCGVASVEVWPVCVGGVTNTVSISIGSGAMTQPASIEFSITAETEAEGGLTNSNGRNSDDAESELRMPQTSLEMR
jgi:hypothetical protein